MVRAVSRRRLSSTPAFALVAVLIVPATAPAGSSVRRVLSFDSFVGSATVPAKSQASLTPQNCRTPAHTAGPGEIAIASVAATASPVGETDAGLRVLVTRAFPSQPFNGVNVATQVESLADGTAMVSSRARVVLVEGQTSQFGAGLTADVETEMATLACQGVVVIYAEDP